MKKAGVVVGSVLLALYVIGVLTDNPTETNKEKEIVEKIVAESSPETVVNNTIATTTTTTTTTLPVVTRPLPKAYTYEDDEQFDCQQELGLNYCEDEDLEEYYYGEEW